jgi:hypothetical protein
VKWYWSQNTTLFGDMSEGLIGIIKGEKKRHID